jgi:1,4-alpha-glucan branching enzyme
MIKLDDIDRLRQGRHPNPFGVLGRHVQADGTATLSACLVGAQSVVALVAPAQAGAGGANNGTGNNASNSALKWPAWPLHRAHEDGVFSGPVPAKGDYRLQVTWANGRQDLIDDPYRFGPLLGDIDVWLLAEGTHLRPYELMGATPRVFHGVDGTNFAVWAPNAQQVSVVGDFNHWDRRRHPMRLRPECGVWEIFLPGVGAGQRYKFALLNQQGELLPLKADPYARQSELRPATASVVALLPPIAPMAAPRQAANGLAAPVSIYEVHLGSWRRTTHDGSRWMDWDHLADTLLPYAKDMGFTHLELMPIAEHPFDGSWGYQTLGAYAPTARYGDANGLRRLVDRAHAQGLGVLLDWVPGHFPADDNGLAAFDGTALFEYADRREGFHPDWHTLVYNYGRVEVRNFLAGNALYWLERYGFDGLRVDAVASMIYRDYSRKPGQWLPNAEGGRENLEAISLLKHVNEVVCSERVGCVTMAEESTAFPAVSRPTYAGGLGFHFKWNMGWMHDTLNYMARDPIHRSHHHNELSFGLVYAFNENFVLPLSHDEVVHGKGSLLSRMPGDEWQRFANLRAYYGFMWGHPGKKLLFMGCEFAQVNEWNHDQSLDWHLLEDAKHSGVQRLVRDLNHLYTSSPALYTQDFGPEGFEWIDYDDASRSLLSFVRKGKNGELMLVLCNFSPVVHLGHRLGVPAHGVWQERLNTDSTHYGGSNVGTPLAAARSEAVACNGRTHSIVVDVPPLATVFWSLQV